MKALAKLGIAAIFAFAAIVLLLLMPAQPQAAPDPPGQTKAFSDTGMEIVSPNIERNCIGNVCTATLHSASRWIHNGTRFINFTDYVKVSLTTEGFNFSWPSGYAVFEPAVNYSGTIYTWSDIPLAAKSLISKKKPLFNHRASWQWGFNLTLPQAVANNLNNFSFRLVSASENVRLEGLHLISGSGIAWNFVDLLDKGYTVEMRGNDTVWVGNVTGKTFLDLDPTSEQFGQGIANDTFVYAYSTGCISNYGTNVRISIRQITDTALCGAGANSGPERGMIKFNLSNSSWVSIQSATLYMNESAGYASANMRIAAYFVNDSNAATWSESAVTWANQPCGNSSVTSLNGSCNQTKLDEVLVTDSNAWYSWDVTKGAQWVFQNFTAGSQILSIMIVNLSTASVNSVRFDSKDATTAANRPYLNITYTVNTAPTVTSTTPANQTRTTSTTINLTWGAFDADGDALTNWYYLGIAPNPALNGSTANNFSGSIDVARGQQYWWTVLTGDGTENTSKANERNFSVNTLATTNTPTLNTTRAFVNDAIRCTATITDNDNATVQGYAEWRNGTSNSNLWRTIRTTSLTNATSATIDTLPGPFVRGDSWLCRVIPEDALENGTAVNSSAILVNTLPSAASVQINNSAPTYADLFGVNATITDQDNGTVQTYVSWYNGSSLYRTRLITGITNATNSNLDAIAGGTAQKGQVWLAALTPNDGLENGTQTNSSVTIANTAPTITHVLPANNTNTTTRAVVFAINFTDPDAETNWTTIFYVNNGSDTAIGRNFSASVNATNISITSNVSLAEGRYTWFVRVNDTTANTASASFNITVDLTNPSVTAYGFNLSYITFNQTVLLTVNTSDNFAVDTVIATLVTSGGSRNVTLAKEDNGNFSINISQAQLGGLQANGTLINLTAVYTNDTANNRVSNTSSTYLRQVDYSRTTHSHTKDKNEVGNGANDAVTFTAFYNETTTDTAITSSCRITIAAVDYGMINSGGVYTRVVNTNGFTAQQTPYTATCNNTGYITQTSSDEFTVKTGSVGGGGGGEREVIALQLFAPSTSKNFTVEPFEQIVFALRSGRLNHTIVVCNPRENSRNITITAVLVGPIKQWGIIQPIEHSIEPSLCRSFVVSVFIPEAAEGRNEIGIELTDKDTGNKQFSKLSLQINMFAEGAIDFTSGVFNKLMAPAVLTSLGPNPITIPAGGLILSIVAATAANYLYIRQLRGKAKDNITQGVLIIASFLIPLLLLSFQL